MKAMPEIKSSLEQPNLRMSSDTLLSIDKLKLYLFDSSRARFNHIIEDASFRIKTRQITGLVGESGSGKTQLAYSILGMVEQRPGVIGGSIHFQSSLGLVDLLEGIQDAEICRIERENGCLKVRKDAALWDAKYGVEKRMRALRGRDISVVMQSSRSALNPFMTVEKQISEAARIGANGDETDDVGVLLQKLNIEPIRKSYPHALSGGQLFRVSIAMALAAKPRLLIADEPTTGMDSPLQVRVVDLFEQYRDRMAEMSDTQPATLIITHNMALITRLADWVAVMYCGYIVERAHKVQLYSEPTHPYTALLLKASRIPGTTSQGRILGMPGKQPDTGRNSTGCIYRSNCPIAAGKCAAAMPEWRKISDHHFIRCHFTEKLLIN